MLIRGQALREELAARAEHQRMDEQDELVHQLVLQQRPDQLAAAEHDKVLFELCLDLGHPGRHVLRKERGVLPRQRLLERGRRDVLLRLIERRRERVVVGLLWPEVVELLIGPATEEQRAAAWHFLAQEAGHYVVVACRGPAAVLEAIARVFVRPPGPLHHAIEGHVVVHYELAHGARLLSRRRIGTGRYSTTIWTGLSSTLYARER